MFQDDSPQAEELTETTVQAIVIRTQEYGEGDLIVRLMTNSLGKVACMARHARKSKKRFPSNIDIFDQGRFTLKRGRGELYSLMAMTPTIGLKTIRTDLDKLTAASLLCESFDFVLLEGAVESYTAELFELLDLSLNALDESTDLRSILKALHTALLFLVARSGVGKAESFEQAGTRSLRALLDCVENFAERPLNTRSTIEMVMDRLKAA